MNGDIISSMDVLFHLNESWILKNSLNAGSTPRSRSLRVESLVSKADDFLLCGDSDKDVFDRQICANSPSICRRPLRMRKASVEEMLSKATDSSDSIVLLLDKSAGSAKTLWSVLVFDSGVCVRRDCVRRCRATAAGLSIG